MGSKISFGRKGAETDSRAKFGKETTGGQNGLHIIMRRLTQGVLRMLRLGSGSVVNRTLIVLLAIFERPNIMAII